MNDRKQGIEPTWIGRDKRPKLDVERVKLRRELFALPSNGRWFDARRHASST